ncbi:hypothetical protein D3C72_1362090 [compost metagenome]
MIGDDLQLQRRPHVESPDFGRLDQTPVARLASQQPIVGRGFRPAGRHPWVARHGPEMPALGMRGQRQVGDDFVSAEIHLPLPCQGPSRDGFERLMALFAARLNVAAPCFSHKTPVF